MSLDVRNFYSEIGRLRRLNEFLCSPCFFEEQGYTSIETVPQELLKLSFPVFSPVPFLTEVDKILDIGCGVGLDIFMIHKKFPQSIIVALDLSLPLLKENKKYNNGLLLAAEGRSLPFKEHIFDCVIMNGFFNLIDDKACFLKDVTKILKSKSFLFVADIFVKKKVEIPDEGSMLNIKGALKLKELFTLFKKSGFVYEKGTFNVNYTKEFGLFGILWKRI